MVQILPKTQGVDLFFYMGSLEDEELYNFSNKRPSFIRVVCRILSSFADYNDETLLFGFSSRLLCPPPIHVGGSRANFDGAARLDSSFCGAGAIIFLDRNCFFKI